MREVANIIARKIVAQCQIESIHATELEYTLFIEPQITIEAPKNHRVFVFYYELDREKMLELYRIVLTKLNIPFDEELLKLFKGNYFCALPKGWN